MQATIIDPADVEALETALNENKVSNKKFLDRFLISVRLRRSWGSLHYIVPLCRFLFSSQNLLQTLS